MWQSLIFLLTGLCLLCLVGCQDGEERFIQGSGDVIRVEREVAPFTSILLQGPGYIRLKQGPQAAVTVTCDDNMQAYVTTTVQGEVLKLGERETEFYRLDPSQEVIYDVTVTHLQELKLMGDGRVKSEEELPVDGLAITVLGAGEVDLAIHGQQLVVTISGSGRVTLSGKVEQQTIILQGTATYAGLALQSEQATVKVAGAGKVGVAVEQQLAVHIAGAGSVVYKGNPAVTQHITGVGKLRSVDKAAAQEDETTYQD